MACSRKTVIPCGKAISSFPDSPYVEKTAERKQQVEIFQESESSLRAFNDKRLQEALRRAEESVKMKESSEENYGDDHKIALQMIHRMELDRNQNDIWKVTLPPSPEKLTPLRRADCSDYFSGTRTEKSKERKRTRTNDLVLRPEQRTSTPKPAPVPVPGPKVTVPSVGLPFTPAPPPSKKDNPWLQKGGGHLFGDSEQGRTWVYLASQNLTEEDAFKRAVQESLNTFVEEQQYYFNNIKIPSRKESYSESHVTSKNDTSIVLANEHARPVNKLSISKGSYFHNDNDQGMEPAKPRRKVVSVAGFHENSRVSKLDQSENEDRTPECHSSRNNDVSHDMEILQTKSKPKTSEYLNTCTIDRRSLPKLNAAKECNSNCDTHSFPVEVLDDSDIKVVETKSNFTAKREYRAMCVDKEAKRIPVSQDSLLDSMNVQLQNKEDKVLPKTSEQKPTRKQINVSFLPPSALQQSSNEDVKNSYESNEISPEAGNQKKDQERPALELEKSSQETEIDASDQNPKWTWENFIAHFTSTDAHRQSTSPVNRVLSCPLAPPSITKTSLSEECANPSQIQAQQSESINELPAQSSFAQASAPQYYHYVSPGLYPMMPPFCNTVINSSLAQLTPQMGPPPQISQLPPQMPQLFGCPFLPPPPTLMPPTMNPYMQMPLMQQPAATGDSFDQLSASFSSLSTNVQNPGMPYLYNTPEVSSQPGHCALPVTKGRGRLRTLHTS